MPTLTTPSPSPPSPTSTLSPTPTTLTLHRPPHSLQSPSSPSHAFPYPQAYKSKLYSPTIYEALARVNKNRGNSLYTLCTGLHVYEQYCQGMREKLGERERMEGRRDGGGLAGELEWEAEVEWNGMRIAQICLEISQDINETQHRPSTRPRKPSSTPLKLQILSSLDWQINLTTFITVAHTFFTAYKKQIVEQFGLDERELEKDIEGEIQIVMERFCFLEKGVWECAGLVVQGVLAACGIGVVAEGEGLGLGLEKFLRGESCVLEIKRTGREKKVINSGFFFQLSENWPSPKQPLFSRIKPLKQSNKLPTLNTPLFPPFPASSYPLEPLTAFDFLNLEQKQKKNKCKSKLAQFRDKIIHNGHQISQYFKPFDIFARTMSNNEDRNGEMEENQLGMEGNWKNKENQSGLSTRNTSFQ